MMFSKLRKTQLGQSLVEVMITALIIALSVTALIRFQSSLSYNNALSKQTADASLIAKDKLENLMDFQVLTTTAGYAAYSTIASGSSSSTVNGTAYSLSWTVTSYSLPTYKNVSITVSWTDRWGLAQSVTINSNIAGIEPSFSALII